MAIGRTNAGGAGGAALNFKVIPGLTQPGTAAENTIWVKTERLTGWYFAATQPENMQEGEVWFPTGTESPVEFNALKKNSLQVYPMSAKQMIGGALVDVETMSYQGGKWVALNLYLLWHGEKLVALREYRIDLTSGSISDEDGYVYMTANRSGGNYKSGHIGYVTEEPVDLTSVKQIDARVNCEAAGIVGANTYGATIIVCTSPSNPSVSRIAQKESYDIGELTITLDTASLTGSYYIAFGTWAYVATSGNLTAKAKYYDILLS